MSQRQTIMFIDLAGSTRAYEAAGNTQVAEVIAHTTQWIDSLVQAHRGRTLKFLGDGVLARFTHNADAVEAAVAMQRQYHQQLHKWPPSLRMGLKIGIACGDVVEMRNDAYGDAVNLSARLCDMAGENTIWASEWVISDLPGQHNGHKEMRDTTTHALLEAVRYRSLGMIRIRGLAEPQSVFQIEWSEDLTTDLMTVRGVLPTADFGASDAELSSIGLSWLGTHKLFSSSDAPIGIGRIPENHFVVNDQRVSRQHARIDFQDGAMVLTDLSSFGTWVRFAGDSTEVPLRRTQLILHGKGEMALGASFEDFSAPVIAFHVRPQSLAGVAEPDLFGKA